jgi:S-layer protein
LDGGAGTDTLNVTEIGATGAATYTLTTAATVKNIEVVNYTVASDNIGDAVTADLSGYTGLQTVNVIVSGTDAPLTALTTKGNATAASVNGATTAGITDSATTDTLASVTLTDVTGSATLTSDALKTVTLKNSSGGTTVVAAAATRALTVNLDGVTGGTLTDAEATSLTLNATGTKSSGVTLAAAKATAVTVNAAVATSIADVTIAAAKTVTITGAGAVTVAATTTTTALTSVDASTNTGGVTITPAVATGVAFAGGSGKDAVTLGATTKAVTMGAGDDTVTVAGVAALGTDGSVDAGDGTDTLVFSTYANAVTASGATTFAPTVSGFERLELSGANAAAGAAVNLSNLDSINYVTLSATNTETTTISNFGANGTIVFKASQTLTKPVTVSLKDSTGTSDTFNAVLSNNGALSAVGLTAAGVETINVTSTETATTLLGTVTHGVEALVIADATTLNIAGNAGATITTLTGTKLTTIDASGVTAGLVSFTTDALTTAATIKGGAAANTIVASAATKAVTYTGQDKVDTITINNALNNVVDTAAGNDVIVTGSGADTINAGAGDDTITSGAGVDTINAGAGNDTITSGTGLDAITGGAGNDTFILTLNANGTTYASIKDIAAGDIIQVADKGTEVSFNGGTTMGAKISLGSNALFTDYLNAAAVTSVTPATNGVWSWFQFGGNTYVVADQTNATTFTASSDFVVELAGLIDLTNSTGVGTNAITIV